jgi:hypothetical protein
MAISISTRTADLYTRRGNTRTLWRSTAHTNIDVTDVSWGSAGVTDLTPRLASMQGTGIETTHEQIANLGARFQQTIIGSRTDGPFEFRFYSSKDLTDEIELLFADTGAMQSGYIYVLTDVPFAEATDSEASRCDWVPVYTFGAVKDLAAANTAASYSVKFVPRAAWTLDDLVAP